MNGRGREDHIYICVCVIFLTKYTSITTESYTSNSYNLLWKGLREITIALGGHLISMDISAGKD